MGKTKGRFLWRSTWYSICSAHREYKEDCPRCNVGGWSNDIQYRLGAIVFKKAPGVWRWWANRKGINFTKLKD